MTSTSNRKEVNSPSVTTNRYSTALTEGRTLQERKGNWTFAFLLVPLLCCAGPFVVMTLAVASAAVKGVAVGIFVALVAAIAYTAFRRRLKNRCCTSNSVEDSK